MSTVGDAAKLECAYVGVCPLYDETVGIGHFFILADFYPLCLTIGMYAVSIYCVEIYLFFISLVLTFDWPLNLALRYIIAQPGPFPGCGSEFEMPSFATQHIVLFDTLLTSFVIIWRREIPATKLAILKIF